MKLSSRDIIFILRAFGVASDQDSSRQIDKVNVSHPSKINTAYDFRFKYKPFVILLDETAEDNAAYITEQIRTIHPEGEGNLLKNQATSIETYGFPFKGKDAYVFEAGEHKTRLDVFLAQKYPDQSRSTWQKHIKAGHITVNGQIIDSPHTEISDSDNIGLQLPESKDYSNHKMEVIFEDDNILAVNKPTGVLTHSKGALNDEFTVAEYVRSKTTVATDTNRPGIVHRLDRDTSGIIITAKTEEAFEVLKHQFANRLAKKTYLAIIDGTPKQPTALIDLPIGRNPKTPSTFRVDPKGKAALTSYEVIASSNGQSLVVLQPKTGRTHQLRVHMSYLGTPISGDVVYNPKVKSKTDGRMKLHALALEITIPLSNRVKLFAPIDDDFLNGNDTFKKALAGWVADHELN